MEQSIDSPRPIRFEDFELDTRAGELRKAGVRLKLTGQPLLVLAALLERPGEVVTRDELQKRLWPDTFVDVDHNLNTAINKIREALGDSAETPRYVETIPRRGYRFIGKVDAPTPAPAVTPIEPIHVAPSLPKWVKIGAFIAAILVLIIGAEVGIRSFRHAAPKEKEAPVARPFTALPGMEIAPAFSPDGSRIAFAWNGDPASGGKGFNLYVKAIGSETMLRLTQSPSEWLSPTWSPDGTQIAFQRIAGADTGIYVVPALGGPERKLRSTKIRDLNFLHLSWSPDGKWIGFADVEREDSATISLISTETGEVKRLSNPPPCRVARFAQFSHTGKSLAFLCDLTGRQFGIYSVPLEGGSPKLISSSFGDQPVDEVYWSSDDAALLYRAVFSGLHEISISDGKEKRLDFAGNLLWPAFSLKGDMLAFSSYSTRVNLWRKDLLQPESPAVNLIPSTRSEFDAAYSPDGKHIAFSSDRSGVQGVWVSRDDGTDLVEISSPSVPSGSPQWSPDGKQVAFDANPKDRWEVYIADISERIPRKLATNLKGAIRPSWSHDGKWIYFLSNQSGRSGPFRCPAGGGDAIPLSRDTYGSKVLESFDTRKAFFATHDPENTQLREVSLDTQPGVATDAIQGAFLKGYSTWTLAPGGIYFVPANAPRSLRYFDFATNQTRTMFELDKDFGAGLSVSPDGRWILYAQIDEENTDIMLVDHFH